MLRTAWCLLLGRCNFGIVARTVTPRTAIPVAAIKAIAPVEAAAAAVVAVAIPVDLAHHRRGPFLVLVDAHREVAQHVFAQSLLPLDLGQRGRRRIELEQG